MRGTVVVGLRHPGSTTRRETRASARRSGPRVLIVEASDFAGVLGGWLAREGWAAWLARDGVDALDLLGSAAVDLVVLDLQSPGLNGWELLRHLRGRWEFGLPPSRRRARTIAICDRREAAVARFARRLGADAFLPKPVDRATLVKTVASLFSKNRSAANKRNGHRSGQSPGRTS